MHLGSNDVILGDGLVAAQQLANPVLSQLAREVERVVLDLVLLQFLPYLFLFQLHLLVLLFLLKLAPLDEGQAFWVRQLVYLLLDEHCLLGRVVGIVYARLLANHLVLNLVRLDGFRHYTLAFPQVYLIELHFQ